MKEPADASERRPLACLGEDPAPVGGALVPALSVLFLPCCGFVGCASLATEVGSVRTSSEVDWLAAALAALAIAVREVPGPT